MLDGRAYEVPAPVGALLVNSLVGNHETVHAGQALARFRIRQPGVTMVMAPQRTASPWWFEVLAPIPGRVLLGSTDESALVPGRQFKSTDDLLIIESGNVRVLLRADMDGMVLDVVAREGAQVEFGTPLLRIQGNSIVCRSPMVGDFYRAPAPHAAPFVEVGQTVRDGDTLCLIEALKLENLIKAETDGVVSEVHVEDGAPIEYGGPLFTLTRA